jgi:hypothetical protein
MNQNAVLSSAREKLNETEQSQNQKTMNKTKEKIKFTPFPPDERPNPHTEE